MVEHHALHERGLSPADEVRPAQSSVRRRPCKVRPTKSLVLDLPPRSWRSCDADNMESTPVKVNVLRERLTLDDEAFTRALGEFRRREQEAGRPGTLGCLCEAAGINDRVFRRARTKHTTLPRHQVVNLAKLLGCQPLSIVFRKPPWDERDLKDRIAWPVPLREVASWVEFVEEHLARADSVLSTWNDDVLSLAAAPALDAFNTALRYSLSDREGEPGNCGCDAQGCRQ